MAVTVRSVPQILSSMVRRVLTDSPLTDVNPGSVISTILEAAAMSDYQNSLAVIKVLESSKLEALVGTDLDSKAIEMNLPNGIGGIGRKPAQRASGIVTIESAFTKQSTTFYLGKPAPFTGATTVYLQDCANWPLTGQFYIGRGSTNEEGPIKYTSLTNNGGYYTLVLDVSTPLLKPHRYDEAAILSQGGVRVVPAGTKVYVPPSDNSLQVEFSTDYSVKLLDGESTATVQVTCLEFGENGNVISGAIKSFSSTPFSGATVTNELAFSNGTSAESDEQLRQRIRNYPATLSKGTSTAINASIQGLRDSVSGKTVTSVSIVEPISLGEPAKCYIDDGTGLEPAYNGQSFENLLPYSSGRETLFKTSQAPITPCMAIGTKSEPFVLQNGQVFTVVLDGISESFTVYSTDFVNLNSVTASEIVNAFNTQAVNVAFRTTEGGKKIVCFDMDGTAETMRVYDSTLTRAFGMSTEIIRPLFLFQNNKLLSYKGSTATLQTTPFPWTSHNVSFTAAVKVDGVLQTFTVSNLDFTNAFRTNMDTASPSQWAQILMSKIAGVNIYESQASNGGTVLVWQSWQQMSSKGSLEIISSGSWVGPGYLWDSTSTLSSFGAAADYEFNRLTGQIRLINAPLVGDQITVASSYTRAQITSIAAPTGQFALGSISPGVGVPKLIVGFDGDFETRIVAVNVDSLFTATPTACSNIVRLTVDSGSLGAVTNLKIGDCIYLGQDTSLFLQLPNGCTDLYRIKNKGTISQYWIEIEGSDTQITAMLTAGEFHISAASYFAFKCEGANPQIVDFGSAGSLAPIDTLISIGNSQIVGGKFVKVSPREFVLSSCNFKENTSVAIFATIGQAKNLFTVAVSESIQPHTSAASSNYLGSGFAKVQDIYTPTYPNAYYPRQGGLKIEKTFNEILSGNIEAASSITDYPVGLQELSVTGRNAGLLTRSYNLNSVAPFEGFVRQTDVIPAHDQSTPTGGENVYGDNVSLRLEDLPINFTDRLVVEMDQDPINGTSVIQLFKKAAIQTMTDISAGAKGTVITFTLKDPDDSNLPFFDNASAFKNFDFSDFNILFRSSGLHYILDQDAFGQPIVPTGSDPRNAILLQNSQYGDSSRLRLSFEYVTAPNVSTPIISHESYSEEDEPITHISVALPSGDLKAAYLYNYNITPSDYTSPTGAAIVKLRVERSSISNPDINATGDFVKGQVLVIGGNLPLSGSYLVIDTDTTWIDVIAPGIRSVSYSPVTYQIGTNPLYSIEKGNITIKDMVDALNNYQPTNPVVSAKYFCNTPTVTKVLFPTYITQGNPVANTSLTTMAESVRYHAVTTYFGSKGHIYLYDSLANEVKAVVQSEDPLLPTLTDRLNVPGYTSYADEIVYIVPSNLTSLNRWLNFTAVSSLTFSAEIDRVENQEGLQIAANKTGSQGSVLVTGLNADRLEGTLKNVPLEQTDGTFKFKTNFAIAQSLPRGSLVELINDQSLNMLRPYATAPSNVSGSPYSFATSANSQRQEVYFRDSTNVVWRKIGTGIKLIFTRSLSGYDVGGTNTVEVTKINDYIVQFKATGTNILAARVGDMLTVRNGSPFPSYMQAKDISSLTAEINTDVYLGYPVVHVEDIQTCYVIAPNVAENMTIPVVVSLLSENDIYFTPMLICEKNIRTNWKSGAKFNELLNASEKLHYRIKPIGLGFVYAEFNTDSYMNNLDMQLAGMMVNTDDVIEFKTGFDLANQGKFKIVAHNGRNAIIFKNDNAVEELIADNGLEWGNLLADSDIERKIRIWDADSVDVGHRITINAPTAGTTDWFDSVFLSTWNILETGITSPVVTGEDWPSDLTAAGISREMNVYVIINVPNAPNSDIDPNNNVYQLGLSASSITFQEPTLAQGSTKVIGYRWVAGYGYADDDNTLGEVFLAPKNGMHKMLPQYGTTIKALHKTAFPQITSVGVDGYRYYTELIAECHKVIDGSPVNTIDYPGVRSAGSAVEVLAPLIRRIKISLSIIPKEGVSINSIKQSIKSVVSSYVNGLGVGREVILSEIIKSVQQIPGVKSVEITTTNPASNNGSINVGSFEAARVLNSDDVTL